MNEQGHEMRQEQLQRLLRSALPPIEPATTARDAWPLIVARLDARPAWTVVDLALAAGIVLGLTLVPEALFMLALHF